MTQQLGISDQEGPLGVAGAVSRTPLPFDADLFKIRIDLLEPYEDLLSPLLSAGELEAAAKLTSRQNRLESGITRACLKLLAAERLSIDPGRLRIIRDGNRKPYVTTGKTDYRAFNVSHSFPWSLIGFADTGRIGVDIEVLRPIDDVENLASLTMDEGELDHLTSLAEDQRGPAFLKSWTQKEAVMKVLGIGVTVPLRDIHIVPPLYEDIDPVTVTCRDENYGSFTIVDASTDEYAASIAYQEDG
jgi:4'-phosphopantetheinyl transferase